MPNLCRAWVIADLQGTRQYLPTFTHATERPSTKFLSTSRIQSIDHRLIAIIKQTTKCAAKKRFLSSLALLVAVSEAMPQAYRLLNGSCRYRCLYCF